MASILQCPVCRAALADDAAGKSWVCQNHHSFDAAKQGYVNLLLAHKKHSKEPGDNAEMIRSRREFLSAGFYQGLSTQLNHAITQDLITQDLAGQPVTTPLAILDAGCGEGYYLERLQQHLQSVSPPPHASIDYYGLDISKFAVRQACQRGQQITWLVGSSVDLPFLEASLDRILVVFAPVNFQEFARVLKPKAKLILVTPRINHLKSLRAIIYDVIRERHQAPVLAQGQDLFQLCQETAVTYTTELNNTSDIMNLLAMTPYLWNIDLNTKAKIAALTQLTVEVDVGVSIFEKTS
jgi:23S rRNA (guanine745-N1)-methyltransferase